MSFWFSLSPSLSHSLPLSPQLSSVFFPRCGLHTQSLPFSLTFWMNLSFTHFWHKRRQREASLRGPDCRLLWQIRHTLSAPIVPTHWPRDALFPQQISSLSVFALQKIVRSEGKTKWRRSGLKKYVQRKIVWKTQRECVVAQVDSKLCVSFLAERELTVAHTSHTLSIDVLGKSRFSYWIAVYIKCQQFCRFPRRSALKAHTSITSLSLLSLHFLRTLIFQNQFGFNYSLPDCPLITCGECFLNEIPMQSILYCLMRFWFKWFFLCTQTL